MYFPEASNSSTCGAGTQHSACGGDAAAPRMSALIEDGSWTIQMWSRRSTDRPRTGPRKNVSGIVGQAGSTRRAGGEGFGCAATAPSESTMATKVSRQDMTLNLTPIEDLIPWSNGRPGVRLI